MHRLVELVCNVPGVGIDVRIAEVARKNHSSLYKYVEADILYMFRKEYGALPWFNQQREKSKEGRYGWENDAVRELTKHLGIGSGRNYQWAIQPTKNNLRHKEFSKGLAVTNE